MSDEPQTVKHDVCVDDQTSPRIRVLAAGGAAEPQWVVLANSLEELERRVSDRVGFCILAGPFPRITGKAVLERAAPWISGTRPGSWPDPLPPRRP